MVADEDYTLLKGKDWQPQERLLCWKRGTVEVRTIEVRTSRPRVYEKRER
jgi:hypothetical protein